MRCRYSRFEQVREALARRKDSVGFAEKAFGPDSLARCEAEYQLALSEFDSGHLDEAVLGFSSALRLHSKLPQQDSYLLANILLGLGNVQHARSYWSQALECYSQAMHVLRESREKDAEAGPMTSRRQIALASILVNIALVHMERGDMVFANASCDTDTHTLRCKLGQTDRCCNSIFVLNCPQASAERELRRASKYCASTSGGAHRNSVVVDVWHNLSTCLYARGQVKSRQQS